MHLSLDARAALLLLALLLTGCPVRDGARYAIDPARARGLPKDPEELIRISDAVLAVPHHLSSLKESDRALAALEVALARRKSEEFELLWRLARACFRMTEQLANKQQRLAYAQTGREYAERARAVQPGRVEPHYYLALNTAKVAEAGNKLTLIKPMIAIAEAAARIDPRYDEAGAYRFIGKVYLTAPAWPVSVGSPEKAIEFLERAVSISPIAINRLFLGEAYFHDESYAKAKLHIGAALRDGAKLDPRWRQEGESYLRRIRDKDS